MKNKDCELNQMSLAAKTFNDDCLVDLNRLIWHTKELIERMGKAGFNAFQQQAELDDYLVELNVRSRIGQSKPAAICENCNKPKWDLLCLRRMNRERNR